MATWLGHSIFEIGTLSLVIRRMPAFFETFPLVLIDQQGTQRAIYLFVEHNQLIVLNKLK